MGWIHVVTLTSKQRRELQRLVARPAETVAVARRAHVVLWSADGISGAEIARRLHLSVEAVSRIRRRFLEDGGRASRRGRSRDAPITPYRRRPSSAWSSWRCRRRRRGAAAGRPDSWARRSG